jgi:hypothetical protein
MGEDTFIYTEPATRGYSDSFPIKLEGRDDATTNGILPYNLGGGGDVADPYSADPKMVTGSIARPTLDTANSEYTHGDMLETYSFSNRPTLHHMPSLSATSCNSDSFHESGDITGYEYAAGEAQEFDWAMHSNAFQWPNNRTSPIWFL